MREAFYYLVIFINSNNIHDVYWNAATIILKNIDQIPELNITEVADMCYVSTATISRLCRKLNYESFIAFKESVCRSLSQYNENARSFYYDEQVPAPEYLETEGKESLRNHFDNIQSNLQETFDSLDYVKLMQIIDMIHNAKRVFFYGNYYTQSCANQLQIELSYQGKECFAPYPVSQQKETLKGLKKGDLVIISTIAGSFLKQEPDLVKKVVHSDAKMITISQLDHFKYSELVDLIFTVGNKRNSLIGKFSITYVFELLELIYHIKYEKSK